MSGRQLVAMPVEATVSPVEIAYYPEEEVLRGGWQEPDYEHRPPAVFGWCRVKFHFGRFVCSKNISGRFVFSGHVHDGWQPSADELAIAAAEVERQISERLAAHGLRIPEPPERGSSSLPASRQEEEKVGVIVSSEGRGGLGPEATVCCTDCGEEQWFLNPTPERVKWYQESHRCGGSGWQG